MTTTNPHTSIPYRFKNGNHHDIPCGKCGKTLQEGDLVVFRPAPCLRHLGYLLHGRHVVHIYHEVDAHGEPLYEE